MERLNVINVPTLLASIAANLVVIGVFVLFAESPSKGLATDESITTDAKAEIDFAAQFATARPSCRASADFAASVGAYVDEQGKNANVDAIFTAFRANPGYADQTYPVVGDQALMIIASETIKQQIGERQARRYWLSACLKENGIKPRQR